MLAYEREEWAEGHYLADLSVGAGGDDGGGGGHSGAADSDGGVGECALSLPTPLVEAAALPPPPLAVTGGGGHLGGMPLRPAMVLVGGTAPVVVADAAAVAVAAEGRE